MAPVVSPTRSSVLPLLVATIVIASAFVSVAAKKSSFVTLPSYYEEALVKLNASGFTSFVSLISMYGRTKQMSHYLARNALTVLVPTNEAITKANLSKKDMTRMLTIVSFQVIKGAQTKSDLQKLKPGTRVETISMDKNKKPLYMTKVSPASGNKKVILVGRTEPVKSAVAIMGADFYTKNGKLSVHTTNSVVVPEGF